MPSEPDYSPVPADEGDPESGKIPSSFYQDSRKKGVCPRSYSCRRRAGLCGIACIFLVAVGVATLELGRRRGHLGGLFGGTMSQPDELWISTWNIAAINNNPFEYWITYKDNPKYEELMLNIEKFLEEPGDKDVPVSKVFTEEMFAKLDETMTKVAGWKSVKTYWDNDFKNRTIVSQFMKDTRLGSKRLASMPDRITNTINVADSDEPVCRPTVINMYDGDLSDLGKWWAAWQEFMFTKALKIKIDDKVEEQIPYTMLKPIKKSKYPSITEEEEKDSLPLQTMCGAIFDAILVHMMNTVSKPDDWQSLKKTMVDSLNKKKIPHTRDILANVYGGSDIITLQEVSSSFIFDVRDSSLGESFHVIAPEALDPSRDQNSVIMLKKTTFPTGSIKEITSEVKEAFESADVPVADGDILAITTKIQGGTPFVVASFHGDTNGLATKPVLTAIKKTIDEKYSDHHLIFGLDANTYENATPGKQQDVMDWGKHYVSQGLTSCWGDVPQASNYTTYNARTYLQPQLNKACKKSEKREKGDVNPKDFILFGKEDFEVVSTWKDNTGEKKYIEDMAFPTLDFPSDHGILATQLKLKKKQT